MHERVLPVDEEAMLQQAVDLERQELREAKPVYGSGQFPEAELDGTMDATFFVRDMAHRQPYRMPIRFLELGGSEDAALWTGGRDENPTRRRTGIPLNNTIRWWPKNGINHTVTVHSGKDTFAKWTTEHGVDRFLSGHFLDAVNTLLAEKEQYDVIISRRGLCHTAASLHLLKKINRLLSPRGAAFIDGVVRQSTMRTLIYPPDRLPAGLLRWGMTPGAVPSWEGLRTAMPGAHWSQDLDFDCVAWRKSQFDESRFPKLVSLAPVEASSHLCAVYSTV